MGSNMENLPDLASSTSTPTTQRRPKWLSVAMVIAYANEVPNHKRNVAKQYPVSGTQTHTDTLPSLIFAIKFICHNFNSCFSIDQTQPVLTNHFKVNSGSFQTLSTELFSRSNIQPRLTERTHGDAVQS